jgi:hypothetical protein
MTAFQKDFSLMDRRDEAKLKKEMAEKPRKFMFCVKYRTMMMEVDEGEF